MKNIVFDLGGVLFARDRSKCSQEFIDFFSFVHSEHMPTFWEEYDRGTLTLAEVIDVLCRVNRCSEEKCASFVQEAIRRQETVKPTEQLIGELKAVGYRLYVLSNMSREFIDHLRRFPVYRQFDGDVVSCEVGAVKPEPEIYRILLDRFALEPSQTLFIDDRPANIVAAERLGIHGLPFDYYAPAATCAELRQMLL